MEELDDLQASHWVPDRRRAERDPPGRSRVRGRASRAGACRDSRGARRGVRVVGPTPAAASRRERAPARARSARSARSRGAQAAAGAERGAGAPGLRRTAAGAGTGGAPSGPAALGSEASMEITRINEFQAKPDQAAALRDFLRSVIARIIDAPGCRSCELLVQRDDPTRLAIIEVWDSVEAHQASVSQIPPRPPPASAGLVRGAGAGCLLSCGAGRGRLTSA